MPGRLLRLPLGQLSDWATGQRMAYSRGHLSDERIAALEAVPGWAWDTREAKREAAADAIAAWLDREGPLDPIVAHRENGVPIRGWIARFRSDHERGELDAEFAALLVAIPGWSWTPLPTAAEERVRDEVTGRWT